MRAASELVISAVTSSVLELEPPVMPALMVPPFFGVAAAEADGEPAGSSPSLPQARSVPPTV